MNEYYTTGRTFIRAITNRGTNVYLKHRNHTHNALYFWMSKRNGMQTTAGEMLVIVLEPVLIFSFFQYRNNEKIRTWNEH